MKVPGHFLEASVHLELELGHLGLIQEVPSPPLKTALSAWKQLPELVTF